jgi:hypothetical protein
MSTRSFRIKALKEGEKRLKIFMETYWDSVPAV